MKKKDASHYFNSNIGSIYLGKKNLFCEWIQTQFLTHSIVSKACLSVKSFLYCKEAKFMGSIDLTGKNISHIFQINIG